MSEVVVRPPSHPRIDAAAVARQYADDVISGRVVAGKLVKLAAKRFLRDLKNGHLRGLRFDAVEAQRVVDFFGFLKHSKCEWGGQTFVLAPWQVFILVNLFGWKRADGTRRFREGYIEVARKNGKTTFIAGIGLYMLLADDEAGAEIYSAATKKDQALILFDEACRMRKQSSFLAQRIANPRNNLNVLATNSKFEPLSSDEDTLDGLNIHCALVDELHKHKSRGLYDVLFEATKSRRQPLVLAITTAGSDRKTICWKQREVIENILCGNTSVSPQSDAIFGFIACIDEGDAKTGRKGDDYYDEKNWPKANPNLGVCVKVDGLREAAFKAKEDPTALNSFLRKHMNVWTSQDSRWMAPEKWAACNAAGPLVDPVEQRREALAKLKGRLAFGGLDLSSKSDLSAFVLVFPPVERETTTQRVVDPRTRQTVNREVVVHEADPKWHVLPWFFVPEGCVANRVKKDRVEYDVWIRQGFIAATPGPAVDQGFIRSLIGDLRSRYQVEEIGYDSWNASQMGNWLVEDGIKIEEVRQGFRTMSEPMKELMAMVLAKKVEHYGNPVLSWNASNMQAEMDPAGNIKPDKEQSKEKIDGIPATLNALFRIMQNPAAISQTGYDYGKNGITFI